MDKNNEVSYNLRIPEDMYEAVRQQSIEQWRSINSQMLHIIDVWLKNMLDPRNLTTEEFTGLAEKASVNAAKEKWEDTK